MIKIKCWKGVAEVEGVGVVTIDNVGGEETPSSAERQIKTVSNF